MPLPTFLRRQYEKSQTTCLECKAHVPMDEGYRVKGLGAFCSEEHAIAWQQFSQP